MPIATTDIDKVLNELKKIEIGCQRLTDRMLGDLVSRWLDVVDDAEPTGTVLSVERTSLTIRGTPDPLSRSFLSRSAELAYFLGKYWDTEEQELRQGVLQNEPGHNRDAYIAASRAMHNFVMDYWQQQMRGTKRDVRNNEIRHLIENQFVPYASKTQ